MSGGEPFLHPNFVELCKRLTKKHHISINTNLSLDIDEFCKKINPKKVEFIHCALHLDQRKKLRLLERFIEKVKKLKKNNFDVYITQVMTPELTKNFGKTFNFFLKKGLIIKPKILRGNYKMKEYPPGYTKKQKRILNLYLNKLEKLGKGSRIKKGKIDPTYLDKKLAFDHISWKGKTCLIGKSCFFMEQDGSVYGCLDEKFYLGNLYQGTFKPLKKPIKCSSKICTCPFFGYLCAEGEPRRVYKKTKFLKSLRDFLGGYYDYLKRKI